MKIKVTQENIDGAEMFSFDNCMVARSFKDVDLRISTSVTETYTLTLGVEVGATTLLFL